MCSRILVSAGFEVEELPFGYSAWPGLCATPVAGGIFVLVAAAALGAAMRRPQSTEPIMSVALATVGAAVACAWWVARFGTRRLTWMRRSGTNLVARRGVPRVWLVAHLDSKSQPLSLLLRAGCAATLALAWGGTFLLWLLSAWSARAGAGMPVLVAIAAAAALPLLFSQVGSRGTGALDNASGVAAVLAAARTTGDAFPLGVVITSGEELGLAGARAWADGATPAVAINCDGVDDSGALTVTAPRSPRRGNGFDKALAASAPHVRRRRALPGVLLDATALADAGWVACTVSKGTLASLARIHTSRDTLENISGSGIDEAAKLMVTLCGAIIAGE